MANNKTKNEDYLYTDKESTKTVETTKIKAIVDEYEDKKITAAATAALKTAINANAEQALRESEREYAMAKRKYMLEKCKSDPVVTITPSKLFANVFGSVYTFNYNGIPVTVYFNSKPQKFPKFIADKIQEKILSTSEANTYKEEIEHLF